MQFCFQLCREIGGMTITEMLDKMSADELIYWSAFFDLENERNSRK